MFGREYEKIDDSDDDSDWDSPDDVTRDRKRREHREAFRQSLRDQAERHAGVEYAHAHGGQWERGGGSGVGHAGAGAGASAGAGETEAPQLRRGRSIQSMWCTDKKQNTIKGMFGNVRERVGKAISGLLFAHSIPASQSGYWPSPSTTMDETVQAGTKVQAPTLPASPMTDR